MRLRYDDNELFSVITSVTIMPGIQFYVNQLKGTYFLRSLVLFQNTDERNIFVMKVVR